MHLLKWNREFFAPYHHSSEYVPLIGILWNWGEKRKPTEQGSNFPWTFTTAKIRSLILVLLLWGHTVCMACPQKRVTTQGSGGWMSRTKVPSWSCPGESPGPGCRWLISPCFLTWWKDSQLAPWPLIRALIPFMRAPSSWPDHLPKAPLPTTVTLGVRIPT